MKYPFLVVCLGLLSLTFLLAACNSGLFTPPGGETGPFSGSLPFLTQEEKALVREYCLGGNVVVRWPDENIGVYDATGNAQILQRVLDAWNSIIQSGGGRTRLYLSNNPNSPIRIYYDPTLLWTEHCGLSDGPVVDGNYRIIGYELKIRPEAPLGSCNFPNTLYALFLRRFAEALGIKGDKLCPGYADYDYCPYEMWTTYTSIPNEYAAAIRILYRLPLGYNLSETVFPWAEITEVKGVVWDPRYQRTKYRFLLVDYCGRNLLGPPTTDKDYKYPSEFASDFVVDNRLRFVLVILGKGFGNTKGRVWLEGTGMVTGKPQRFLIGTEDILQWTDTKIVVYPRFDDPRAEPMHEYSTELGIERQDGTASASRAISIIPSIGRQPYGQCTWWTNVRLIEEKGLKRCRIGTYDNPRSMEGYIPQKHDILVWYNTEHRAWEHQAFVEEVFSNGKVKISQYNQGYSEAYSEYTTGDGGCYRYSDRSSCAVRYIRLQE